MSTRYVSIMVGLLMLAGCSQRGAVKTASGTHIVSGTLAVPAGAVLPSDAVVSIELSDITRQDVAAILVADTSFGAVGRTPPFVFTLPYNPARIDEHNTYAVRAVIRGDERLLYTTDHMNAVITRGNPSHVDLEFIAVAPPAEAPAQQAAPPLEGALEARGNEPFWAIRVEGGNAVVKTPEELEGVEYGGGAWVQPAATRWIFTARRESDGKMEQVTLEMLKEPCSDSMSGAEYAFRAVITRGGQRMEGCGMQARE